MRKIAVFLFALVLFSRIIFAEIIINEIMAKPIADESLNEYIEIYNNGSPVDVRDWSIGDDSDNDTIEGGLYNKEGTIIPAFGYAIITDETTRVYDNFNVSDNAIRLYIDDASIGRYGLNNNAETVYLYDANGNLVDKASYNKTSDGLSWSFLNGSWFLASPTPGYNNNGTIISFVAGENCDFSIEIILGKTIFNNDEFSFRLTASKIIGDATNITGRASINDLYGTIVKEYGPWTDESITRQRTSSNYTPNLEQGPYIINANLTTACIDSNLENNFDSRLITIKGLPLKADSEMSIEDAYDLGSDKKAKFGQIMRFKLNIYKGDTSKNSISAWVESKKGKKVSAMPKTNVYGKYKDYSLTLPLQITPNCDKEFKDGSYYIVAKGLDLEATKKIEIEGLTSSLCKAEAVKEKNKKFEYELLEIPEKIEDKLEARVRLTNNENKAYKIKIWSYVYRGKNSYSGNREENKKEFLLFGKTSEIVELKNNVINAKPGNYKYKVVINKDEQKTNKEIIKDVVIENKDNIITEKDLEAAKEINNPEKNKIAANAIYKLKLQPKIVYESADEKIKKLAIIFLIMLSVIFNIILLWRR